MLDSGGFGTELFNSGTSARTKFTVVDHGVRAMLSATPKVTTKMLIKALTDIGATFCYNFTAMRLGGPPGITMRKRSGGPRGSNMKIPPMMRAAGFKGRVFGQNVNARTRGLWIGTRSPAMMIHEKGGTISAKNAKFLAVKSPKGFVGPIQSKGFMSPMWGEGKDKGRQIFLVRKVKLHARLGFITTWLTFVPRAYSILQFAVMRSIALINSGVRS